MKKFLLRILALIGGVAVSIASGLLMFALYRAGFQAVSVFITIPTMMLLSVVLSLVFPSRFELHGMFALVFMLSDEIEASGKDRHMGWGLLIAYIIGWFGLFVSAIFMPGGLLTGIVAVASYMALMLPGISTIGESQQSSRQPVAAYDSANSAGKQPS